MTQHRQAISLALARGGCTRQGLCKQSPLFSRSPGETASSQWIDHCGPFGSGIELVQPAFVM